jgi:hypothetical protein
MKQVILILFIVLFNAMTSYGQKTKIGSLSDSLSEISGLVFLNDSIMIAHNDGGHDPCLYFLNLKGETIHEVYVNEAKNNDWEDISIDNKGFIYVADIGNNNNKRKNLCIYKINSNQILTKSHVDAEKISFSYPDQTVFPPKKDDLHYDAEAICCLNDSIYIFTKCRTKPFDGLSYCYSIPCLPGKYTATKHKPLNLGQRGMMMDAITGVDVYKDTCYILTYNRVILYQIKEKEFVYKQKINLAPYSQKEAIAVSPSGTIYFADEVQKYIGGGNLYKIIRK